MIDALDVQFIRSGEHVGLERDIAGGKLKSLLLDFARAESTRALPVTMSAWQAECWQCRSRGED